MNILINKRGDVGDNLLELNVVYLILFLFFLAPTLIFVNSQREGAALLEDFYAKEIARIIDISKPETEAHIDVTKGIEIAKKRGLKEGKEAFNFNNVNNEVVVKLRQQGGTALKFFNNVDVINWEIKETKLNEEEKTTYLLYFTIIEAQK